MKNIADIIKRGESETLEFKTAFGNEVIETAVAFANHRGGTILIGVADETKSSVVPLNVSLNVPLSEKIFRQIKETPGIQRKDLAAQYMIAEKTVGRYISELISKGKIERRGSKKTGGYWAV